MTKIVLVTGAPKIVVGRARPLRDNPEPAEHAFVNRLDDEMAQAFGL